MVTLEGIELSVRGKSYTEIVNMLKPREYDSTHYLLGRNRIISKDEFERSVKELMKRANR